MFVHGWCAKSKEIEVMRYDVKEKQDKWEIQHEVHL